MLVVFVFLVCGRFLQLNVETAIKFCCFACFNIFVTCVQEVDLLLNDGSKQINAAAWKKNSTLSVRVETSRRRSRRCLLMTLALAETAVQQVST